MLTLKNTIDEIIKNRTCLKFQDLNSSENKTSLLTVNPSSVENIKTGVECTFTSTIAGNDTIEMKINNITSFFHYDHHLDIYMGVRTLNGKEYVVTIFGRNVISNMLIIQISYHQIHKKTKSKQSFLTHDGTIHPLP